MIDTLKNSGLYMRTLELAQVQPEECFAPVISGELITTPNDLREPHKKDTVTADEDSATFQPNSR